MSKPVWSIESNTTFGPFQERESLRIDFTFSNADEFIPNPEDPFRETDQFISDESVRKFEDEYNFYIRSYGLPNGSDGSTTSWPGNPPNYTQYTPRAALGVYQFPRNRFVDPTQLIKDRAIGYVGLAKDGVLFKSVNSQKVNILNGYTYTENSAIFPVQNFFLDGSGIIDNDRKFYYQTDPKLIYSKDPTMHSPIIGYAFDGNPIYGPYGYSEANDDRSPIRIITSSYQLTEVQRADGTIPDGTYIEDFVHVRGSGDLDQYNARDCVTPEYPNGVHAYFITVDPSDANLPRYPYIVGPNFYAKAVLPNGDFRFPGDITVSLISGKLPAGMRIEGHSLVGRPFEVAKETTSRFVLRATNLDGVSDRTFSIIVQGSDAPEWSTPAGKLPMGKNNSLYIIDNDYVEFALNATDVDLPAGDKLKFYIPPKGGILPPGLILTPDGVIKGYPKPLLALLPNDFNGNYDKNVYEAYPYDHGERPTNGYDTFLFDNLVYDYYDSVRSPKKLNRYYEFTVRVTDGLYYSDRVFKVFVVGDDFFRADTTIMKVGTNTFTADNTYLRKPIWITPKYLGRKRANNYITVFLDTYDSNTLQGPIGYILDTLNPDIVATTVSPVGVGSRNILVKDYNAIPTTGMKLALEYNTATTYTIIYVERAVFSNIISYKLTLNKAIEVKFTPGEQVEIGPNITGEVSILAPAGSNTLILKNVRDPTLAIPSDAIIEQYMKIIIYPIGISLPIFNIVNSQRVVFNQTEVYYNLTLNKPLESNISTKTLIRIGADSKLPPGMQLDETTGEIYGDVPYQPAITTSYRFTVRAIRYDTQGLYDRISSLRTFTLDIIGEVNSVIKFITPGDLKTIPANFISDIGVLATTTVPNAVLNYSLVSGKIPPGLKLVNDGTLQGKVNQFSDGKIYRSLWKPNRMYRINDLVRIPNSDIYYQSATNHISGNSFSVSPNWVTYDPELSEMGLIVYDDKKTTFDNDATQFDRNYAFTILAQDQFKYSAISKSFKLSVETPNNKLYSNIYVKPFMSSEKRVSALDFFTDSTIFERDKIYRPGDPNFGVQQDLKMLIYAGIETKHIDQYVAAFGRSYRKKFRLGSLKKAVAKEPGTNKSLYEVIYIEVLDNQESVTGKSSDIITTRYVTTPISINQGQRDIIDADVTDDNLADMRLDIIGRLAPRDKVITADFGGQLVSDSNKTNIFGNSITTIRKEIDKIGDTERNFLPLWMRTPQSASGIEQGFTKGIVICYCILGQADYILLNIKHSNFDFKKIDFTVDRVIIDSVQGESGDKYIAFAAREVING
jgi:hypothetical protein